MSLQSMTPEELAVLLGEHLRRSRVLRRFTQAEMAALANVSERSISALECGTGSTVATLLRIMKALDKLSALDALVPIPSVDPLSMLKGGKPQYRRVRKRKGEQ